ncbi:MAG: class I SAM-dependent methyltransferase [Candidatus Dormibacteraeota bacterium]|nr:class I SAM-dependent methyltransferase [Candidatus Dormibacteraeota bacterium]
MRLFDSLFFRYAYLVGFKPWDSGIPPPELVDYVEGAHALEPERALDLGCGTGTNVIYMARHGWQVTGVDFVPRAIRQARRKAAVAGVSPRLIVGDVTRLGEVGVTERHGLILDLGCLHTIPEARRDAYASGVTRAAAPGAVFLVFGFAPGALSRNWRRRRPAGLNEAELRHRFRDGWELEDATQGTDPFESWWYRLRKL